MKKTIGLTLLMLMFAAIACAQEQLAVGAQAPPFALVNAIDGKVMSMKPDDGRVKVVIFTCNECPYAKAFEPRIIEIAQKYGHRGATFYAVNPNAIGSDTLEKMNVRAQEREFPFPYLKDADSSIARAYGARVTPHVFVVDGAGIVRYRGYVDDTAKVAERKTAGLTDALNALLDGREVANADTRAFGCTIKWKT